MESIVNSKMDGIASASSHIESGIQLLKRINKSEPTQGLKFFPNGGPFENNFVGIYGDTVGRTTLLTNFMIRCALPKTFSRTLPETESLEDEKNLSHKGNKTEPSTHKATTKNLPIVDLPGQNRTVYFINTDQKIDLFHLISIIETLLKQIDGIKLTDHKEIVKATLENIFILNCFDRTQLSATIYKLGRDNIPKDSVVMIDSLCPYYFICADENWKLTKLAYYQNSLKLLEDSVKMKCGTIFFTMSYKIDWKDEKSLVSYLLEVNRGSNGCYEAKQDGGTICFLFDNRSLELRLSL